MQKTINSMNACRDILEELRINRKVVATGMVVTPRLVVYSPTGNHTVMLPLPDDETDHRECLSVRPVNQGSGSDAARVVPWR